MQAFEESQAPLKRFVKRVPSSAAAPSFKLTMGVRFVLAHLQHLVDSEFELASHPDAIHTWQGSIVPRRNKDRSEYTLQGWRLWAEAHNIQAGDQVSFELVTPRKMVLQVIRPEQIRSAEVSPKRDRCIESPHSINLFPRAKSPRSCLTDFPTARQAVPASAGVSEPLLDDDLDTGDLDLGWSLLGEEMATTGPLEGLQSENDALQRLAESPRFIIPEDKYDFATSETQPNTRQPTILSLLPPSSPSIHLGATSTSGSLSQSHQGTPVRSQQGTPISTMQEGHNIFSDVHHEGLKSEPISVPQRAPGSMLSRNSSVMDCETYTGHGVPLARRACFTSQGARAHGRQGEQDGPFKVLQSRLDRETRCAMKATIGLESCITDLTPDTRMGRERQQALFNHLRDLKTNLWHMLVLSVPDHTP